MQRDWWKGFFDEHIGDFMLGSITPGRTSREVQMILKNAHPPRGAHILDLACGRGRHSFRLAAKGFRVTGLDYSKSYVETATRLARRQRVVNRPEFIRGDMRKLRSYFSPGTFDLAVSLFNSFGYFSKKTEDRRVLHEVFRVLKPGGLLILNTANHSGVENRLCRLPQGAGLTHLDRWEQLSQSRYFLDRARYDSKRQEIDVEWHFLDLKKRTGKKYSFQQNVYSSRQMDELLTSSGFSVLKRWAALEGGRFEDNSWHQTVLARKIK